MSIIIDTEKVNRIRRTFEFYYSANKPESFPSQMALAGRMFPLIDKFLTEPSEEVCIELVKVAISGFVGFNPQLNVTDFLENVYRNTIESITANPDLASPDSLRGGLYCARAVNTIAFSQGSLDKTYPAFMVIPITWMLVN